MSWKFLLDNNVEIHLDQLPPDLFDKIAATETDASWYTVYRFPGASTARLWKLYVEACNLAKQDPGDEPVTLAETIELLERLESTEDVEDEPMENGYPPTQGTPETGSSFGVPDDSDGLLTSLDNNESETS